MHEKPVKRFVTALAVVLAAAPVAAVPAERDPVPAAESYAYGWPIVPAATADFYELELPLEVYRAATDPSLRDLGVYNADGEPVPRLISPAAELSTAPDETVALAPLPVRAPTGTPVAAMRFALERSTGGTSVRIEGGLPAVDAAELVLRAYIADLGEATERLRAVEIEWPREIEPLIAQVTVEGSEDLDQWFVIGSGTIAGLRQEESNIERRRIATESRKIRYLRLGWGSVPDGWQVTKLTAHYSQAAPEAAREWLTLTPTGRDKQDGGYLYEAGGSPLVDRVALDLPADNSLVRASVRCRQADDQPWRQVHNGLFYRLRRDGSALASDPAAVNAGRCTRWKIVIERGDAESGPGLRLGWRADRLLFIAQGTGPWQLVAGSARDAETDFPQVRRFSDPEMRRLLEDAGPVGAAALGARVELGGELSLEPSRSPEWRRWLLWAGLASGVLLVAGMAWRLAKPAPG